MIFYENHLLADNSHEIAYFLSKIAKMSQNLSSAAVAIGALRVNPDIPGTSLWYLLSLWR